MLSTLHSDEDDQAGLRRTETMGGLVKGLAIIELFGSGKARLSVSEAARDASMTRPAARRCLLTLEQLGYLAHDGKYFTPNARLRRLGGGLPFAASFAERAQPILDDACERLGESVSLAVLDGRDSLFVARAESVRIVSTGVRVGGRLPAYCSATGRILLGALNNDEVERYLRGAPMRARTDKTVIDPDALFRLVVQARQQQVAYSDEELEIGMRSMAVPVNNAAGEVVAACSLSAAASRVSLADMKKLYLPILREAADRLR